MPRSSQISDERSAPPAPSLRASRKSPKDTGLFGDRISVAGRSGGRETVHPGVILGRIRAYDGAPAADATVAVLQTQGENPLALPERPVSRKTQTGPEGAFEIAGLPMGNYSVLVSTGGYAEVEQAHLSIERPIADFDMKLSPSEHIAGVVRDTEGQPIADATVWAMQPIGTTRFRIHRLVMHSVSLPTRLLLVPGPVTSDGEGKFRFEGL
ncbi:MAG: carboxypeptidase-like regulatory domain-containing protein, partial [Candidatus Hydrogenedentes bacterium]|nr:carboxypeptidase-like regulatory domain-containing protein [Candidatus Hydrogenedentota bacterium]